MHHKLDPIKALIELSRLLPSESDESAASLKRALRHVAICCGADRAFVSLWEQSSQSIRTLDQWQIEQLEPMPTTPIPIDEVMNLDDYFEQNKGMFTLQRIPIIHAHQLVGMLSLESRDPIEHLSSAERELVANAARLLAPYVRSPKNVDGSNGDDLTLDFSSEGPLSGPELISQRPSVLIVEDNKINQLTIAKMVKRFGAEASLADDGLEGINACQRKKFDLILMDLSMPHLDGFDTTREIVTTCELNKETPIVAITANVGDGVESRCLKVGMAEYVAKPVRWKQMCGLMDFYLKQNEGAG